MWIAADVGLQDRCVPEWRGVTEKHVSKLRPAVRVWILRQVGG